MIVPPKVVQRVVLHRLSRCVMCGAALLANGNHADSRRAGCSFDADDEKRNGRAA